MRIAKDVDRIELAQAVGISYTSLYRLETGMAPNAPLWWYTNCAIALGVKLEKILDPQDQGWHPSSKARVPPGPNWPEAERAARERRKSGASSGAGGPRLRKSGLAAPD